MTIQIRQLTQGEERSIIQAAEVLVEGFKIMAPKAWPTIKEGLEEVKEMLGYPDERFVLVACDSSSEVVGWIGGIKLNKQVWEIHPLVTAPALQGQGIGRKLVEALECEVLKRGGSVVWLGSDDEADMTSLSGKDVYPNPLDCLCEIKNLKGHPYEFYQKLGYTIVGMLPDANGFGKPDIFLAKRLKIVNK